MRSPASNATVNPIAAASTSIAHCPSSTQRPHNLTRSPNPPNRREEFRHARRVKLAVAPGHGVVREHEVVSQLVANAGCRLDADVRRDAAQHDRLNAAAAKLNVEVRSVERA